MDRLASLFMDMVWYLCDLFWKICIIGEPTFIRSVPNGKLYKSGGANLDTPVLLAHVWGTPYEMGFAHGIAPR